MDTPSPAPAPLVALHIGASSVSLLVAEPDAAGGLRVVEFLEQPAPLARDIFRLGRVTTATTERVVEVIGGFRKSLAELDLDPDRFTRAVATNIIVEAENHEAFLTRIRIGCGIDVESLDDGEMTRLVYLKTRRRLEDIPAMRRHPTLVVHVGPGNTRALLFRGGSIVRYTNYRIGTHRTREAVEASNAEGEGLRRVIREHVGGNLDQLHHDFREAKIAELVAIGYELQLLSRFAAAPGQPVTTAALRKLAAEAAAMSDHQMVRRFRIDYQTAEALLPSLEINLAVAETLGLSRLFVPTSIFERGLLRDLLRSRQLGEGLAAEVVRSARSLARRFHADPRHGRHVATLCARLFDALASLHRLDPHDALLLHVAAILHEVGSFVSSRAHHKHSEYIILNSEIFGLDRGDVAIVALVARYHRHSGPSLNHPGYRNLSTANRLRVAKLAALLRVADALERSHDQRVGRLTIELAPGRVRLHLHGIADAAIERLAMKSKGDLFAQVFGREVVVEEDR